jgi:hypothetical protein
VDVMSAIFATTIFVLFGMAPTLVSIFVQRRPGISSSTVILMFNLAGLVPIIGLVWSSPMEGGTRALGEMLNWLIIYGAAATGAIIAWASPHASAMFTQVFAGSRSAKIKARQKELYDEWGTSVVE